MCVYNSNEKALPSSGQLVTRRVAAVSFEQVATDDEAEVCSLFISGTGARPGAVEAEEVAGLFGGHAGAGAADGDDVYMDSGGAIYHR